MAIEVDGKVGSEMSRDFGCKLQANVTVVDSDNSQPSSFGKLYSQHAKATDPNNGYRTSLLQPGFFECIPYGGLYDSCESKYSNRYIIKGQTYTGTHQGCRLFK